MGKDFHVGHSKCIRKSPQQYDPVFGDVRKFKSETVGSLVYMIQYENYDRSVDIVEIIYLLVDWDA